MVAIDPGLAKCGLAVVSGPEIIFPRHMAIVETDRLVAELAAVLMRFPEARHLLIGGGTGSAPLRRALRAAFPTSQLTTVNEEKSSERGRQLFLSENSAQGWRKLIPKGLRSPERPYDDYVALLLAEDYFSLQTEKKSEIPETKP